MDGLTLLSRARDAGLAVAAEGDTLVIRGPKRAAPVAWLLLEHKPEVMAALAPAKPASKAVEPGPDAAWWRRHYLVRTLHWGLSGSRPESRARVIAWGELVDEWQRHCGARIEQWRCAGCGEPIGGLAALDLAGGNRVHFSDLDCLLSYGKLWRREAVAGLQAFGLDPPEGVELL